MVGIPTRVEDSTNSLTIGEIKKGWKITSLLQGSINPSDMKIAVESKYVEGEFVVESVGLVIHIAKNGIVRCCSELLACTHEVDL